MSTMAPPESIHHGETATMHIAILTFEGFNELDSLIALGILNRVKKPGWRVSIASPAARVKSMAFSCRWATSNRSKDRKNPTPGWM